MLCGFHTFQIGLWGFGFYPFRFLFPILGCFNFDIHFEVQNNIPQNRISKEVITRLLPLFELWRFRFTDGAF